MNNKFMKPFLLLAMLAVGLVSCSPDDGISGEVSLPPEYVECSIDVTGVPVFDYEDIITFPLITNTADLKVTQKPTGWSTSIQPLSTGDGYGIHVKAPAATATAEHSGTIEVTAYDVAGRSVTAYMDVTLDYEVSFDDANFESCLISNYSILLNDNNKVSALKAYNYPAVIDVSGENIASLKGIELFHSMTTLVCSSNQLTSLDLSANKNLISLNCSSNSLTALNLNANTNLETINCSDNQLEVLDLSKNTALTSVVCDNNSFTDPIVFKQNPDLTTLKCNNCGLEELSLVACPALEVLECSGNRIMNLSVKYNSSLSTLNCSANILTSLDISGNQNLVTLDMSAQTAGPGLPICVKVWSGFNPATDIPLTWIYDSDVVWE